MTPSQITELFALWIIANHRRRGIDCSGTDIPEDVIARRIAHLLRLRTPTLAEAECRANIAILNSMKELQ